MYNLLMDLETVTKAIHEKLSFAPQIGARIKFDFGDDGIIFVDATSSSPSISNEDHEADTVLSCSIGTFEKILNGTQDPTMAYMMGKLKIKGSMGYAMKLNSILGD